MFTRGVCYRLPRHELLLVADADGLSALQGDSHAAAIGDEALPGDLAAVLRGKKLNIGLGGIVVIDLGTWSYESV